MVCMGANRKGGSFVGQVRSFVDVRGEILNQQPWSIGQAVCGERTAGERDIPNLEDRHISY